MRRALSISPSRRLRRRAARSRRAGRAEDRVGFVDQREIGFGPQDLGDVADALAVQEPLLGVGEHASGGGADQRLEPEQVVDQLGAAQHRPHAIERRPHLGLTTQARRELVLPSVGCRLSPRQRGRDGGIGDPRRRALGRELELGVGVEPGVGRRGTSARAHACTRADKWSSTRLRDVGPPLVVACPAGACARSTMRAESRAAQPQHVAVEHDDDVARHRPLAVGDGRGDDLGHAGVALHRRRGRRLGGPHAQARFQRGGGGEAALRPRRATGAPASM